MAQKPKPTEVETLIESVEEVETRSGKTRYVVRDSEGREYTTFRPAIGREALQFKGRRARARDQRRRVADQAGGARCAVPRLSWPTPPRGRSAGRGASPRIDLGPLGRLL